MKKSFAKFYYDAIRNRRKKSKVKKQSPKMEPSLVTFGKSDHKLNQNPNSDSKTADQPSSSTFMPKG